MYNIRYRSRVQVYQALYRMMLDSWSVHLTLYRMMLDLWSVYLTFTGWCHVGLVICVSDIYRMMPCWTHDLCIWHYTEWLHVGLVISWHHPVNVRYTDHKSNIILYNVRCTDHESKCIWHYTWWPNVGFVICVSDIIHDDAMLDAWSVYLTLYMMTQCWTRDLCIRHYTEWCWTRDLCIWHYTEWCWTCDLCIWHYTEWIHVGHVICVSDIIQNGFMLALWSCIWHYTEWCHVGLMICLSNIIQNDATLDSWSVYLRLYRMTPHWTRDLCIWHYTGWRNVGLVILWRHPV